MMQSNTKSLYKLSAVGAGPRFGDVHVMTVLECSQARALLEVPELDERVLARRQQLLLVCAAELTARDRLLVATEHLDPDLREN